MCFKSNSHFARKLEILEQFSPVIFAIVVVVLLYSRREFTTKVCLCDFKDYFYHFMAMVEDVNSVHYVDPNNYGCHPGLQLSFNLMIYYELFLSGVHFVLILFLYYYNIRNI